MIPSLTSHQVILITLYFFPAIEGSTSTEGFEVPFHSIVIFCSFGITSATGVFISSGGSITISYCFD